MAGKTLNLTDVLRDYLLAVSLREHECLRRLRAETASHPMAQMQIAPEQGQFLAFLLQAISARRVLELGVFTGYSSLCMALALPPDGRLLACDISDEYTRVARRYWREAGVDDRIDLRLAPALQTLDELIRSGESGTFDFMFIDADKDGYVEYYERGLQLLRAGGIIAVDNVLWSGRVADPADSKPDTVSIRRFNEHLHDDTRVHLSLLPLADGLTLALKL
ncbi:MAG: class I SAM-dependent methyltransferase [Gammaproteobacteria bacterium]|nr:class I SAM-dependent methyltransferase [Gammaproteobacteria bacterium]